MSKGTVTLLVIVFVVCISCGAGYAAYRIVREKLRRLSRMAFGTDSITEGLEQQAKELAVTPKSVSAMTRIFLPQIQRDFPDFISNSLRIKWKMHSCWHCRQSLPQMPAFLKDR